MKVLMMSIDGSALRSGSAFEKRLKEYGELFSELHVIVFSPEAKEKKSLGPHVWLWPTGGGLKTFSLWRAYRIAARLLRENPDEWVITTQEEFTGLVGFFLSCRFGVPWRPEMHTDVFSPWYRKIFFKNKIRVFIHTHTIKRAARIRVVSERIRTNLRQHGIVTIPIDTIPVQNEPSTRVRKLRDHVFTFLVLTRLTREKNVGLMVEAFPTVLSIFPETRVLIVGGGPERAKLEAMSISLGTAENVIFTGWHDNPQEFFDESDVCVLTSWYEGYGLSVIEAMRVGMPVVMTDVGIAGEIMKDGESGFVVPPGDEAKLAEALITIRKNPELRKKFGENAKKALETSFLSKEEYCSRFKKSLELCLQEKKN